VMDRYTMIDDHIRNAVRQDMLLRFNTLVSLTRSHGKGPEDAPGQAQEESIRE
jgi:hypothetical protein